MARSRRKASRSTTRRKKATRKSGSRNPRTKKAASKKKSARKPRRPTFDEAGVTKEMARALEVEPDDLVVEEARYTYTSPAYEVSTGRPEYKVYEDEDAAEAEAIAYVEQMLRDEPEIFNQDWLEGHIDNKALSEWVYDAVMEDDYAQDIANDDPDRFWEEAERWGISIPDEDDDGDRPDVVDDEYVEAMKEAIATDRARDPMDWLDDIYGKEEAVKKAMEVAGFDVEGAARDAVRTDGWAHFLATYDGNYETTPGGFVYVRTN